MSTKTCWNAVAPGFPMRQSQPLHRRFTFCRSGIPQSTVIFHTPGLSGPIRDLELERQFSVWLEMTYPGSRAAGVISHISFTDVAAEPAEPRPEDLPAA
jgi:hypothetical protein